MVHTGLPAASGRVLPGSNSYVSHYLGKARQWFKTRPTRQSRPINPHRTILDMTVDQLIRSSNLDSIILLENKSMREVAIILGELLKTDESKAEKIILLGVKSRFGYTRQHRSATEKEEKIFDIVLSPKQKEFAFQSLFAYKAEWAVPLMISFAKLKTGKNSGRNIPIHTQAQPIEPGNPAFRRTA